ncbi:MAG: hypothetical protein EBZ67_12655, partial [Chitinophagia bacterium]|nr:hypothetical protein [Chitinophagia bacterium]
MILLRASIAWLFSLCLSLGAAAQTLGGAAAFSFLRAPSSPLATALGTANVSVISRDPMAAGLNPALLREQMCGQLTVTANAFFSDARRIGGRYCLGLGSSDVTLLSAAIDYLDYGTAPATDASGNLLGTFRARDHAVHLTASRAYGERWHYGMTLTFAGSAYGIYRSAALLADVGLTYTDTSGLVRAGFTARNMGAQLRTYAGQAEDMPFDLQFGVTKRLRFAPLQFSFTAQRAHRFDILYRDTAFNNTNFGVPGRTGTLENLFRHIVLSVQGYVGERVELTLGYNHLRRAELAVPNGANGMTGFSVGAALLLRRMQVRYARSVYQNGL